MTEETRRSAPSDFRPADRGVDYIENECADGNCYQFVALVEKKCAHGTLKLWLNVSEFVVASVVVVAVTAVFAVSAVVKYEGGNLLLQFNICCCCC